MQEIYGLTRVTQYAYDDDNRLSTYTFSRFTKDYNYDSFGRLESDVLKFLGNDLLTATPSYITAADGSATGLVGSYTVTTPAYTRTSTGGGSVC